MAKPTSSFRSGLNRQYARARWQQWTSDHEAHARATGRARYNRERTKQRLERQAQVALLMRALGKRFFAHGIRAELARRLGVHKSVIYRDVAAILAQKA